MFARYMARAQRDTHAALPSRCGALQKSRGPRNLAEKWLRGFTLIAIRDRGQGRCWEGSQSRRGLWEADSLYNVGRRSFYGLLASMRGKLFRDEDFAELYCADDGRDSVPPSLLATALLLQTYYRASDAEANQRADFDIRWKVALGIEVDDRPFAKSTLQLFRARLILHEKAREVLETRPAVCQGTGYMRGRRMEGGPGRDLYSGAWRSEGHLQCPGRWDSEADADPVTGGGPRGYRVGESSISLVFEPTTNHCAPGPGLLQGAPHWRVSGFRRVDRVI